MEKQILAPIIVFGFLRLDTLKKTINALKNNFLAQESDLIFYLDGARNVIDVKNIKSVKEYCQTVTGFKSIKIHSQEINVGLDISVISGVTKILNIYGKAIVIEDDIVTAPNFLDFMNQALDFYKYNEKVMSIGGFGLKITKPDNYKYDVYSYDRSSSWGWATWKDRWDSVDWNLSDWDSFSKDQKAIHQFNASGSDMFKMLKSCMFGGNMWDIRFSYAQFKQNKITIYPFKSKTNNIGFGNDLSTHCHQKHSRFKVNFDLEECRIFTFNQDVTLNKEIHRKVYRYYSITIRIYHKIKNLLRIP